MFVATADQTDFIGTFNTDLIFGSYDPGAEAYNDNNFNVFDWKINSKWSH